MLSIMSSQTLHCSTWRPQLSPSGYVVWTVRWHHTHSKVKHLATITWVAHDCMSWSWWTRCLSGRFVLFIRPVLPLTLRPLSRKGKATVSRSCCKAEWNFDDRRNDLSLFAWCFNHRPILNALEVSEVSVGGLVVFFPGHPTFYSCPLSV